MFLLWNNIFILCNINTILKHFDQCYNNFLNGMFYLLPINIFFFSDLNYTVF